MKLYHTKYLWSMVVIKHVNDRSYQISSRNMFSLSMFGFSYFQTYHLIKEEKRKQLSFIQIKKRKVNIKLLN